MKPSHTYEIERIKWLLANGYPNYALWRTIKLIVRLKKELVVLRYSQAIVYADLYRHHVWAEYSIRQQLPIIWDFVAGRFRRASPLTRPKLCDCGLPLKSCAECRQAFPRPDGGGT